MHWTEPATADDSHAALEKKLWDAANMLWAGADLKPSEYSPTVLGLIFLRNADVLPKTYHLLDSRTLAELLKVMASIPMDKGGDNFGLIYEYFLGKFAMSEGQKGGEPSGARWTFPKERPEVERSDTTGPKSPGVPHPGRGAIQHPTAWGDRT